MKYIDGRVLLHVLFHINKGRKQELVELIVWHIIVFNLAGRFFDIELYGGSVSTMLAFFPAISRS